MDTLEFSFCGADLVALGSGALAWPDRGILIVGDLHLVKSERHARRGGVALPPYETRDTLLRLKDDIHRTDPHTVICLGDSFDDSSACVALTSDDRARLADLQAGRRWVWVTGNHDPDLPGIPGEVLPELDMDPLRFVHIADPDAQAEISAHYHPKAAIKTRGRRVTRAAFLVDRQRLVLPAYGTYTGGLFSHHSVLTDLMRPDADVILTGRPVLRLPMPRQPS